MASLSSILVLSLVASAFNGTPVSGLTLYTRCEGWSASGIATRSLDTLNTQGSRKSSDAEWEEGSSGARLSGAAVQLDTRLYTDGLAEQVHSIRARTVFRRDGGPAESQSWFLRDAPWIIIGGGLLVLFIVSALIIWFRGRKYRDLDEPAPDGMQELRQEPANPTTQIPAMKVLRMTQGRVTPPRNSQESTESSEYRDALRRKVEVGDLMPSRMQQTSLGATSRTHNAAPPAMATEPLPAEVPKLPPPTAPTASASSPPMVSSKLIPASRPTASSARSSPSPPPSGVAPPLRAMSKTPPIPKITVPDDKPLPNPYAIRDSRMGSVILATPADDHHLPNPYLDSMDGHSPARADTPEPFGSVAPVQPLRVTKKNSTGLDSFARSSMSDFGSKSNLYSLPVLDISSASLALSMSSRTSRSSSQSVHGAERR
ncbi:hypothetical protein C8T65DRAFT_223336 [Cerioporus squamosus]|nr:hypothetical protein C8T65DRAFT_223336 [Cerioporus squamosus]